MTGPRQGSGKRNIGVIPIFLATRIPIAEGLMVEFGAEKVLWIPATTKKVGVRGAGIRKDLLDDICMFMADVWSLR